MKKKSEIFKQLAKQLKQNDQSLTLFPNLEKKPDDEPWDAIRDCVDSKDFLYQIAAVLISGCLASGRATFLLSQTWLPKYLRTFKKANRGFKPARRGLSGADYNEILAKLQAGHKPFLKCIRKPSAKGSKKNRSGIYTIAFEPFIGLISWWEQRLKENLSGLGDQDVSKRTDEESSEEGENKTEQEQFRREEDPDEDSLASDDEDDDDKDF